MCGQRFIDTGSAFENKGDVVVEDRKAILLRAAYDFLKTVDSTAHADALILGAYYDGNVCDGYCLMEDIASELKLEEDEPPLTRSK